jgi:hypothetical protein
MKIKKSKNKSKRTENSYFKKDFYKRLLYIGLCIIPIIFLGNEKGTFRFILLPFFLIGMWNLIMIISLSQEIIDEFFPPKIRYEKETKPFDKFMYYFSSILFFVGLIGQIFEIRKFDNTINGTKLFWTAGTIGIIIAILLTAILKIKFPSVYYESKRRYTVHFGLFLGLFLITTAMTGFINHYFADNIKTCKKYIIKKKGTSGGRSTEYFIHLVTNSNNDERFSIGKTRYDNFNEGEEIELCVVKGKFGYDYVTEFNKITTTQ